MELSREITAAVARFVAQVTALAKELAEAQLAGALDGPLAEHGGRGRRARAPAPPRGRVAIGGRRTATELERLRERLLAHITAHPGQRIEQIKVALGASTSELGVPMQKLIYADLVRSEGERRATRYYPSAAAEPARTRTPRGAPRKPRVARSTGPRLVPVEAAPEPEGGSAPQTEPADVAAPAA